MCTLQNVVNVQLNQIVACGHLEELLGEYLRIGESTTLECLKQLLSVLIRAFGNKHLRVPIVEDTEVLLHYEKYLGSPEILESIYCCGWVPKNCV